jgi:uncharacterized protein (DUF362 family)
MGSSRISRRGFLLGSALGLAAGSALTGLGLRHWPRLRGAPGLPTFTGQTAEQVRAELGMPGPFPGRVVEVHHPGSVRADHTIDAAAVSAMIDRGMTELTGDDHPTEAWRRFFEPGDVVGIKVNPVGRKPNPGEEGRVADAKGSISSPEVLLKVVASLKEVGVRPRDIIVFERYAEEFCLAGYDQVMTERVMDGVRWCASAVRYSDQQVDITGFDGGRDRAPPELARHVVGYDPDVFVTMGYAAPQHDPKDDRRFRSHLSLIVARMVNKLITLPVLKDHRSAGVTLALKNMSHGMNNNVARSHLSGIAHGILDSAAVMGPNQCNTFIPTAVAHHVLRRKATLHIMDGLIAVYEGGPGCWNRTWATWPHCGLFFATDPVAMDHVGWDIIDRKRAQEGWPPVGMMGLISQTPAKAIAEGLAALAAARAGGAATLTAAGEHLRGGRTSEVFDRRTPEHVILAGQLGLGVFDAHRIEHRWVQLQRS